MSKAVKQVNVAMPEFVTRAGQHGSDTWEVQAGQAARGEAWADLDNKRIRVPYGQDAASRIIRIHELMHVRVSPFDIGTAVTSMDDIDPQAVIAAEEFRVNTLISKAGFDTSDLRDGSESTSGERVAQRGDWNGAVLSIGAMAGTKAAADFLRGVKKIDPEWGKALREIEKAMVKLVRKIHPRSLGDITPTGEGGIARGFETWTRQIAEILRVGLDAGEPSEDGEGKEIDAEEIKEKVRSGKGRGKRGEFAPLLLDRVPLTRRVSGQLGRKRVATNVGRNPRRINRMLVDPERRVFDRAIKGKGGVVLIDQSGSMHLDEKDLWSILEAAPGCTVIGYSHRPNSTGVPNTWVLAQDGKVCDRIHSGQGGNGVDGPALEFAVKKRKKNEPIIWVCDGMVTDSHDSFHDNLAEDCGKIVATQKIHMVNDAEEAVAALVKVKRGGKLQPRAIGHIARTDAWLRR